MVTIPPRSPSCQRVCPNQAQPPSEHLSFQNQQCCKSLTAVNRVGSPSKINRLIISLGKPQSTRKNRFTPTPGFSSSVSLPPLYAPPGFGLPRLLPRRTHDATPRPLPRAGLLFLLITAEIHLLPPPPLSLAPCSGQRPGGRGGGGPTPRRAARRLPRAQAPHTPPGPPAS